MRLRVQASVVALTAVAVLAPFSQACSALPEDDTDEGALIGGDASGTEDDAVVLLVRDNKPLCTATLVAPNLLITAHHCVGILQGGRVVQTYEPGEISVRLGGTPGEKAAAVATKIYAPQVQAAAQTQLPAQQPSALDADAGDGGLLAPTAPRGLESTDIAMILVQGIDPAFQQVRPRRIRDRSVVETETVGVVGWNANGQQLRINALRRMKRAGVDVLADSTQQTQVQSPSLENIASSNKAREFITESVACQGDDGAPAFDTAGSLVGFVVGAVGPCEAGSLAVFTDAPAHRAFVNGVLQDVQRLQCNNDSKCGGPGKICDTRTFTCTTGCRTGSVQCASGGRCSSPSELTPGLVGTCSTSSGPGTLLPDGGYPVDPIGEFDSGFPVDPGPGPGPGPGTLDDGGSASTSGCNDRNCGGTTAAPKVCSTQTKECVPGCRIGASPSMCGAGQECKPGDGTDPDVGKCVASTVTAPPPPTLSPTQRPTEQVGDPASSTAVGDSDGGAKGKKKPKKEAGGCSIGQVPSTNVGLGWFSIAGGMIALLGRRRRK